MSLDKVNYDAFEMGTEESEEMCAKHGIKKVLYRGPGQNICHECAKEQDVIEQKERDTAEAKRRRADRLKYCAVSLNFPPKMKKMTLDSFNADCEGEKKALASVQKFMSSFPGTGCLTLAGNMGTGKTHLAAGICQAMTANGYLCHYTTVMRMVREIRSSWKGGSESEQQVIDRFASKYDLLVIDEIGLQYKKDDAIKLQLAEVIDGRILWEKPTILIGNVKTKQEAEDALGSRVIDRSRENGMFVMFDWGSKRKVKDMSSIKDGPEIPTCDNLESRDPGKKVPWYRGAHVK